MKRFLVLFFGALTTSIGSGMTAFGLATWSFTTYNNATAVTLVTLCAFAPIVLLSPVAGWLADRFDRRALMVLGDGGSIVGLLVMWWAVARPHPPLAWVLVGVTLSACLAALTEPALRASVTDLVSPEDYGRSSGLLQFASSAKYLVSPAAAGLVLHYSSLSMILIIDMATAFVTVACSLYVRHHSDAVPHGKTEPLLAGLASSWRLVFGHRSVASAVVIMTLLGGAIGFPQVLFKPILLPHNSVEAVGLAESITTVGMLVGASVIVATKASNPIRLMRIGLLGAGAGLTAFVFAPTIAGVTSCAALLFSFLPACSTGADLIVRNTITNEYQGRAYGLISLVSQLGTIVAFAAAGPLTDHFFNPLLQPNGALALLLGGLFGVGDGRGAALLVSLLGVPVWALLSLTGSPRLDTPATTKG